MYFHFLYHSYVDPALGKLLVIGGGNQAAEGKVEVIDFGGSGLTCEDIPDYPAADCCLFGTFIDGRVELCGGSVIDTRSNFNTLNVECYTLSLKL